MTWTREHVDRRTLGAWSFELRGDEVAGLSYRGRPVLRSIRAVVRDRDWDTAAWTTVDAVNDAQGVSIRLRTDRLGAAIDGVLRLEGSAATFTVRLDIISRAEFATNRTGLVALHPPQLAGVPLSVRHADGSEERTRYPADIAPHQPVLDIAQLRWEADGTRVSMDFMGDTFEMEDQRNWTDASYKTYSRPLSLPFPYLLTSGERVAQRISVTAVNTAAPPIPNTQAPIVLRPAGPFPSVSVGAATAPDPAPAELSPLGEDVLVELDLASPTWPRALARAARSGLPLDVRLVLSDQDCAPRLAEAIGEIRPHALARIAAFWPTGPARHVSDAAATALLRAALGGAGVAAAVVGGSRAHFTELNRECHRLPDDLSGIVFGTTPLFHSLDTEQLVESVRIQRLAAAQAVRLGSGRPVHVGPVTLRPHFNDVATTPPPTASGTDLAQGYGPELLDASDARQNAPELGAWTVASVAAMSVPGIATLSYFEEWGPRGIRDVQGRDLPVAAALRALSELRGGTLLWGDSPDGLVWALGAQQGSESRVLVSNLDTAERLVTVMIDTDTRTARLPPGSWARL